MTQSAASRSMPNDSVTYLSWGAGTQSTAMLVMAAMRDPRMPKIDYAIFADTGDEPAAVIASMKWYKAWAEARGVEVFVRSRGRLSLAILDRIEGRAWKNFPTLPFFVKNADGSKGHTNRACTFDYKIGVQEEFLKREWWGIKKRGRVITKAKPRHATSLQGITVDEAHRMKPSGQPWLSIEYPLIGIGYSRGDCIRYMADMGLPPVQKSACVQCPFRSDASWLRMKLDRPAEFAEACRIDEMCRDLTSAGLDGACYLHESLTPLREVDLVHWNDMPGQMSLLPDDKPRGDCGAWCGT